MTNTELKSIRESRNLTKAAFAALLGTTAMVYGRYESGRSTIPEKISKAALSLASSPSEEKKDETTSVEKKVAAVKKAVDTAESIAKNAKKKVVRKVAEKVVDDLVDIAVANAKAESIPAPSTPVVMDEMTKPVSSVEEKASPIVEKKAAVEEKKPSTPKKTRKPSKKDTSTQSPPAVTAEVAKPAVEEKAAPKKAASKKPVPKKAEKKTVSTPAKTKPAQKKAPAPKKTTKSPSVVIESLSGNQITIESLLTKVPAEAVSIYVKPGENKAYWVSKKDAGSIDLW